VSSDEGNGDAWPMIQLASSLAGAALALSAKPIAAPPS
jgi:hypothetical protein